MKADRSGTDGRVAETQRRKPVISPKHLRNQRCIALLRELCASLAHFACVLLCFQSPSRKGREERPQRTRRQTRTQRLPQHPKTFADSYSPRSFRAPSPTSVKRCPPLAMTPVTPHALKFRTEGRCIRYGHTCIWTTCWAASLTFSVFRRNFPGCRAGRGQRSARHYLSHSCH